MMIWSAVLSFVWAMCIMLLISLGSDFLMLKNAMIFYYQYKVIKQTKS